MTKSGFINEESLLAVLNPFMLLLCLGIMILAAYISIRIYRNTNDFKKSTKLYAVLSAGLGVSYYLADVPVVLIIAFMICGFVASALISNHYFYH